MARKKRSQAATAKAAPVLKSNVEIPSQSSVRSRIAYALGKSHSGARNLYESFGYPLDVQTEQLWGMYRRNDIAGRIIRAYPAATWRDSPIIRDEAGDSAEKGSEGYSPFVEAVEDYFDKHNLFRTLERADRLASVGRYGVLFLGFDDELGARHPRPTKARLLFAQPYGELGVTVNKWCTNVKDPRFGLPELYTLNSVASADARQVSPKKSITAHWTRVLHMAEFLDQDDVYGVPRLEVVYNRLMDLEKVVGGAAEGFWLNGIRQVQYQIDSDASLGDDQITDIKTQADEVAHQLRRHIVSQGITANPLGTDIAESQYIVSGILDLIAGATGVPKRILLGTERGELSSAQDENNWSSRIDERRNNYASPAILRPLVNMLISIGELPEPKGKWWVEWPEINTQDPVAESTVSMNKASALSTYANSPGAEFIVPPQEFRKDILGLPPESDYDLPEPEDIEEPLPDEYEGDPDELEDDGDEPPREKAEKKNMEVKSLYVRRDVLNVSEFTKWAKKQGIELQEDLHVTVMYCTQAIDWAKMGNAWSQDQDGHHMVLPGGPRQINRFGNAIVLEFYNDGLEWRHSEMKQRGAVHSYTPYRPHVTLFYTDDANFDTSKLQPYNGAIALGPEVFEEIKL